MSPGKLATSTASPPHYQSLPQFIPPQNDDDPYQNYVVLPLFIPIPHRYNLNCILFTIFILLFISASLYFLWPSDPELSVVRLRLSKFNAHAFPRVSLDIELDLTVRVINEDMYSLVYESLEVAIMYRGSQLGFVKSDGGEVKAKGFSYVNATLKFDGVEVLSDAVLLIEDMARGVIAFDTVMKVKGKVGFVFVHIPIKAKVSCEVDINTNLHSIQRQNCFPQ